MKGVFIMMKLVPYDIKKVENVGGYAKTKNLDILEKFIASGLECAKVEGWTLKHSWQAAQSLNASIKRFKFANISAISRKGNVYLIKTNT